MSRHEHVLHRLASSSYFSYQSRLLICLPFQNPLIHLLCCVYTTPSTIFPSSTDKRSPTPIHSSIPPTQPYPPQYTPPTPTTLPTHKPHTSIPPLSLLPSDLPPPKPHIHTPIHSTQSSAIGLSPSPSARPRAQILASKVLGLMMVVGLFLVLRALFGFVGEEGG